MPDAGRSGEDGRSNVKNMVGSCKASEQMTKLRAEIVPLPRTRSQSQMYTVHMKVSKSSDT